MDGHGNDVKAVEEEWALPADGDELRELAALGIDTSQSTTGGPLVFGGFAEPSGTPNAEDVARVAAATSFYLRRLGALAGDESLLRATREFELARIERAYGPQLIDIANRRMYFETRIKQLTDLANGLGAFEKKKSIKTSGGTFGIKAVPAKAKITDPEALVAWALAEMPEAVRVTVKLNGEDLLAAIRVAYGQTYPDEEVDPFTVAKREVLVTALETLGVDLTKATIPGVTVSPATLEYVIKPAVDA